MIRNRRRPTAGKRTVLLTAFEPFGGQSQNASAMAIAAVDAARLPRDVRLVRSELPCVFGDAIRVLRALLQRERPQLVICTGQAAGIAGLALERVAINVDDAPIADNAGAQPIDRPIVARGPAAYWSTLPIKAIAATLQREGVPAAISQSAGTFVCNHVFYGLLHALRRRRDCRGGFVHVPLVPEQTAPVQPGARTLPSLPVAVIARGLELAIATSLRQRRDARGGGGALHGTNATSSVLP